MSISIVFQKGWTQGRVLVQTKEEDCIFLNNSHAFSHLLHHLLDDVKVISEHLTHVNPINYNIYKYTSHNYIIHYR